MYLYNKKVCNVSQPVNGLTDIEIRVDRTRAEIYLNSIGYKAIDSYFDDYPAELDTGVKTTVSTILVCRYRLCLNVI